MEIGGYLNNQDTESLPKFSPAVAKQYATLVDENIKMKRLLASLAQVYQSCVINNDVMSLQEADEMFADCEGWYVDTVLQDALTGVVGKSITNSKPHFKIADCKEAYILLYGQPKRESHLSVVK